MPFACDDAKLITLLIVAQENLGICNASEFSMVFVAEGVTMRLPCHMYASQEKRRPVLRCYDLDMALRSTTEYFDVCISSSPLTLTVPMSDSIDRHIVYSLLRQPDGSSTIDQETYIRFSGMYSVRPSSSL